VGRSGYEEEEEVHELESRGGQYVDQEEPAARKIAAPRQIAIKGDHQAT